MSTLARALLPIAHQTLALPCAGDDDEPLLRTAYDALDGFLAEPIASRYLSAVRALAALSRLRRRSVELGRLARRALDFQLDRLGQLAVPGVPVEALRALPADPRAGRRIQALAGLLEAHREIAQRVRAPERLRARIEVVPGDERRAADRRGRRGRG